MKFSCCYSWLLCCLWITLYDSILGDEEMKEFMKRNGEDERLFGKVKIRINNARSAIKKRTAKRAKEMGLEEMIDDQSVQPAEA